MQLKIKYKLRPNKTSISVSDIQVKDERALMGPEYSTGHYKMLPTASPETLKWQPTGTFTATGNVNTKI